MISVQQLKDAFDQSEKKDAGSGRPNNYYPFWNMKDDEKAVIRFLPDKNSNNPLGFMVEKLTHTLIINGEKKNIPCRKMYQEECPVCKVSSAFYKEEGKGSENGKKYWRKKGHIAQALVIEDPLAADEETGENHQGKVRFISIGFQLYEVIKAALKRGQFEDVPFSYDGGYNFVIGKTKQGTYSTYVVASYFDTKPMSLSAEDVEALEPQIVDLSTLLPRDLGEDKITAMLEAALTGAAYEDDSSTSETAEVVDEDEETPAPAPVVSRVAKPSLVKKPVAAAVETDEDEVDDEPKPVVIKTSKPAEKPSLVAKPATAKANVEADDADADADRVLAQIHARRAAKAAK